MYFSRWGFDADREVEDEVLRSAEEARRLASQHFGVHLDGSGDSISSVELILGRLHKMLTITGLTQQTAEPFARPFGAYFGEVLRATYGGEWGRYRIYSESTEALCVGPRGVVLSPWKHALDRIIEGP